MKRSSGIRTKVSPLQQLLDGCGCDELWLRVRQVHRPVDQPPRVTFAVTDASGAPVPQVSGRAQHLTVQLASAAPLEPGQRLYVVKEGNGIRMRVLPRASG
jgi:hypothetical protein